MASILELLEVRWKRRIWLQSLFYAAEHGDAGSGGTLTTARLEMLALTVTDY
jgi:hypothetical protein